MPDQLVEARFDTSEVLDLAEEALDQVSLAIYLSIDQSSDEAFAGRGDTGLCPCGSDLRGKHRRHSRGRRCRDGI